MNSDPWKQVQIVRVHRDEIWRIAELRHVVHITDAQAWYHDQPNKLPVDPFFQLANPNDGMFMGIDLKVECAWAFKTPLGGVLTIESLEDFLQRARSFINGRKLEIKTNG